MRPSPLVNQICLYEIGKASIGRKIMVHAFVVMSNHVHLVVTDPACELPDFMRDFLRGVSKAISLEYGMGDGIFDKRAYSRVVLLDEQATVDKIAYCNANPVRAGLVKWGHRWPGATSSGAAFGRVYRVRRPKARYYRNSEGPLDVSFTLTAPRNVEPVAFAARVVARTRELEVAAHADLAERNQSFVGEQAVLATNPFDCAKSVEERRGFDPKFAGGDPQTQQQARTWYRQWYRAYRSALESFREGLRGILFPAGTWKMVKFYGCEVEAVAGIASG